MRVWITRTRPGADRTAERVRALGHTPVVEPVLEVRPLPVTPDLDGVGAVAFTSANGVAAFARASERRDLPAFAVGAATARAAHAAGFDEVRSADGDVEALAALIAAARPHGLVLHAAGRPLAGDLAGRLAAVGLKAETVTLYETVPLRPLPPMAEVVLVHSPQAGRVLAEILAAARFAGTVLAISEAAGASLRRSVADLRVAPRPEEAALLALMPTD